MGKETVAQSVSYGMGTVITNRVFGRHAEEALKAAIKETARLEGLLSRFIPDSEVSRINASAGKSREKTGGETCELLLKAVEFSKFSKGCFDVTIGPLTYLWAGARAGSEPPAEAAINRMLGLVDYEELDFDPCEGVIGLKRKGQSIDPGGVGKGYAADKVLEVYRKYGITSAFTNFGGNVAVIGAKPDGSMWDIGIQHPRRDDGLIGAISIENGSVVTSGDYQRYFIGNDGERYHHVLDPKTGYPAKSGLVSVTVASRSSVTADALSTALFVAGIEKGLRFLEAFAGTEAVFIDNKLCVYATRGLRGKFQPNKGVGVEWI